MKKLFLVLLLSLLVVLLTALETLAGELKGKITEWKNNKEIPLSYVDIIIGKDIWLETKTAGEDNIRKGKNVVAKTKTDEQGNFRVDIPNGTYKIILWKRQYVPVSGQVYVPGTYKNSLSYDNQPGSTGRHQSLRVVDY